MAYLDPKPRTPSPLEIDARLRARVSEAIIAQGGIRHDALNAFLRTRLSGHDIAEGALFAEPALEGAAGYVSSAQTPADLVGDLLHPRLVAALAGSDGDDYRFNYPAYEHQLRAWRELARPEPRSVLVSSGTGSGKTECFLVPLLNELAHEVDAKGRLSGVRALMLYPLNALIASQEERLRRWTAPFGGDIRFALYNGLMQDRRKHDRDLDEGKRPEQVLYRQTLRADPPPILVTNNTMLEYMTIRKEDHPIVEASRGQLRWIIIDEAHSYVGSAAAEVSLLLRRVLQRFEVSPDQVRFIATSATIGGSDDAAQRGLQQYLADLAGVSPERVTVIMGRRDAVTLPSTGPLQPLNPDADRATISAHPAVQRFVREVESRPMALGEVSKYAEEADLPTPTFLETLAAPESGRSDPVIPLRVHQFVRAIPGLWSCINPECSGGKPNDWPYGALAFERQSSCQHCGALSYEIVSCRECGEPWLNAYQEGEHLLPAVTSPDRDEFAAASARELDGDDEAPETEAELNAAPDGVRRLVGVRSLPGLSEVGIVAVTGQLPERRSEGSRVLLSGPAQDGACPRCDAAPSAASAGPLWPWRFGAPFLVQNATLTMLEGVSPSARTDIELPAEGRQLISFTDSRQGTARFAANIETIAERAYVRSYVYHLVQKAGRPSALTDDRRAELEHNRKQFEFLAKNDPKFAAPYLAAIDRELCGEPSAAAVPWADAVRALASEPIVKRWISQVWDSDRDDRLHRDPEALANFLLLRELARRPRRANALETLGLAKLSFAPIEKLTNERVPGVLLDRGLELQDWKDFLYFLVDTAIRGNFALDVSWQEARWILPRGAILRKLVGPGQERRNPSDVLWPQANAGSGKTNAVLLLERVLGLDSRTAEDRATINDVLVRAWDQLRPLLEGSGSTYALQLSQISISPIQTAWLCPVTNRVLPRRALRRTPNGLRSHSPGATEPPAELTFPQLPSSFPATSSDRESLSDFVACDATIAALRHRGVWSALHDRAATYAPYVRAEEHSAQQPPHRLRAFEQQFKQGEINLLACSTTMEMGVDIGSIEAVLNTNVPPSIANYRQRVGRAGRRGQSFASSLTYARDTPLDREAFHAPTKYLTLDLRSPLVKLDSERIVQRHCNALLIAEWLRQAAGQLTRIKAGDFFGFPLALTEEPDAAPPVARFGEWLRAPSTALAMSSKLDSLTAGTALAAGTGVIAACETMMRKAAADFGEQWRALREQARDLAPDARRGIELQVRRICREPLLSELSQRSILPGHGFPTNVVPFVNDCAEKRDRERTTEDDGETGRNRRYDYPTRNADVAIREYAPGAEIVIDGLVWTSAGVTLNWERPAHDADAKEIQSLRWSWQCRECGEAGCAHLRQDQCTACGSKEINCLQFLAPAGFRVDWKCKPHADTDQVVYIEPQPARISARKSRWEPLLDPALGRMRASGEGMVFHSSRGQKKNGYRICLECGRAAEEDIASLSDHDALMPRRGTSGRCPGNDKTYAITQPLALGYEVLTDVAEFQPSGLVCAGAAWALASALREALARQLGIEPRELGLGVEPRVDACGSATHSIFLYDQSSGGAGYAPRLLEDIGRLLQSARQILDCPQQCDGGCSSCVLVADLFAQQEIVDRRAALDVVRKLLQGFSAPAQGDAIGGESRLSPPVADALARLFKRGTQAVLWLPPEFDLAALSEPPLSNLFELGRAQGTEVRLVAFNETLDKLDDAARAGLRNASHRHGFTLFSGEAGATTNGAQLIATFIETKQAWDFYSRDPLAAMPGVSWGVGEAHPVVIHPRVGAPAITRIPDDFFERSSAPGDRVVMISSDPGRPARLFGTGLVSRVLQPSLEAAGLWKPGELASLRYADKYIHAPLPALLLMRVVATLRDLLGSKSERLPIDVVTSPLRKDQYRGAPYKVWDNWPDEADREQTIRSLADRFGLACNLQVGSASHGRKLTLRYKDGSEAVLLLDQGFGYWQATGTVQHNFRASPSMQAKALVDASIMVVGRGESYVAVTRA